MLIFFRFCLVVAFLVFNPSAFSMQMSVEGATLLPIARQLKVVVVLNNPLLLAQFPNHNGAQFSLHYPITQLGKLHPSSCLPNTTIQPNFEVCSNNMGEYTHGMPDHVLIRKFVWIWPSKKSHSHQVQIKWKWKGQIKLEFNAKGFFTIKGSKMGICE